VIAHGAAQSHQRLQVIGVEVILVRLGIDGQQQDDSRCRDVIVDDPSSTPCAATGEWDADLRKLPLPLMTSPMVGSQSRRRFRSSTCAQATNSVA